MKFPVIVLELPNQLIFSIANTVTVAVILRIQRVIFAIWQLSLLNSS